MALEEWDGWFSLVLGEWSGRSMCSKGGAVLVEIRSISNVASTVSVGNGDRPFVLKDWAIPSEFGSYDAGHYYGSIWAWGEFAEADRSAVCVNMFGPSALLLWPFLILSRLPFSLFLRFFLFLLFHHCFSTSI